MFCPTCATAAPEGAKFCKSCGLNLAFVTQAVGGGVASVDPLREREYRRSRKKISDGIHGSAFGAAFLVAAGAAYVLLPKSNIYLGFSLVVGLVGVIKLFLSIGHIVDAKVGAKLLDSSLQPRSTGPLTGALPQPVSSTTALPNTGSRRLPPEIAKAEAGKGFDRNRAGGPAISPGPVANTRGMSSGRVSREQSSPLRKMEQGEDIMSKLRN